MPIVGTAGHVDHGKSTLIRAITGRDPDRLAEEKRRGLTIDLGFAWKVFPSGIEVGFVDVPGHERFIKNMLAGIEAINVALLVVAADEGWMPQSEEHLAALDLLEIPKVVVAITKVDRVDPDLLSLARDDVKERVAGTVAAGAPIIEVDSLSGRGVEAVVADLDTALESTEIIDRGRPRLWVDRAFTIGGAGTIVTGTLLNGALTSGETIEIYPTGVTARIRSMQSHEKERTRVEPGTRTALNIAGVERGLPNRGTMVGRPEEWVTTDRLLIDLRPVRNAEEPGDRGAYRLHLGTGNWPVRLRIVGAGAGLLTSEVPIPVAMGDRFILMEVGRRVVVAGGRILDPSPPLRPDSAAIELLRNAMDDEPAQRAAAILAIREIADQAELAAQTGGGVPPSAIAAGRLLVDAAAVDGLGERITHELEQYHAANPLRPGMSAAELQSRLGLHESVMAAVVAASDDLVSDGSIIRLSGFGARMTTAQEQAWADARERLASGLAVPRLSELGMDRELLHLLLRNGGLVEITDDLAYLPEQIKSMRRAMDGLPDEFTVADFRDHLGLTRKYAVPLLEYFDRHQVTVREGDLRRLR